METGLLGQPIESAPMQSGFDFPASLTEKYRPQSLDQFVGLEKVKRLAANLLAKPRESAWLFSGPPGTGKTSMGLALAAMLPAELHHIPSQECNLANLDRVRQTCQYVPMAPCKWHLVLADEIDRLTDGAQISLLSKLDATNFFPQTLFIGTTNLTEDELKAKLEPRFVSRFHIVEFSSYGIAPPTVTLLREIWRKECPTAATEPNFARMVKDSGNNVRASLMALETEIMCA